MIDSEQAGLDTGEVLGDGPNGIPVCADLADGHRPGRSSARLLHLRHGPVERHALADERSVVLDAISLGHETSSTDCTSS